MDGVLLTVPDGRILMANPAACRILGRSEEEICRIGRAGVVDQTDPRLPVLLEERARTGKSRGELRLIRPDGTTRPCEITSAVFTGRDGLPWTSMCLRDVTEQKRAAEALRDLSRFNQEILDAIPAHICVLDKAGKIIAVNRAWRDFAAANPPLSAAVEIGAEYFAVCDAVTGDDAGMAHEAVRGLRAVMRGEVPEFAFEYPCHSPDVQRWFLLRSMRLSDHSRPRIVILHINITERKRAEISLRESEKRYRMAVEDQTEIICRFQTDGTITYVNDVWCRVFGKTHQELHGQKWQPRAVSEDLPLVEAKLQNLSPANPVVVIENRVYWGAGEIRWMQFVNRGFFDRDGRLIEIQAVGRDVTERKLAEEKLYESEAAARARADELATELAATPALTFIADDPDCRHMTSSLAALRLLRLPAGANTSKSAPPGERPETFRAMKDGRELRPEELPVQLAAATGQPVKNFEFTFAFDDGTARDIVGDAVPLFDAAGKVRGAVGAFLDITECKRTTEELRLANAYNRSLIEASLDPLVTLGSDGKITDVNAATEAVTGYARDRLIGTDFCDYFTEPAKAREGYQQVFREGLIRDYALELRHRGGCVTSVLYNASVYRDESGQVIGVFAAARDITNRKLAEAALLMHTRQLEAIRAIGEEISRELDLTILLQIITERTAKLMGAASGMVALWDEADLTFVPRAWFGPCERDKDLRWKPGEDIPGIPEDATHTAALVEPLLFGDRLMGVIRIDRGADRQPFTEMDRQLLALFAPHAAIAIQNARLYSGAVRRSEETASLLRASGSLMAGLDLQETLKRIAEEAARITRSVHAIVLLRDREKQTLRLGAVAGRPPALLDNFARGSRESLSAIVASTGQALFIADCAHDPRNPYADEDRALGIVTYLGLPITIHGEVVGVLTVNTSQPREYTSEELEYLASFADLSAIAIENARLFEEVRVGREQMWALSRQLVEVQETERHSIARELHDEIGQLLTGLTLLLEMCARVRPEKLKARLNEAQALVKELMMRVSEMSLDLRPTMLDDLGLLPALLWYFDRYTARTKIRVDFQYWGLERRFPSEIETAAYRIAQEALNNVARHAGVTVTTVCLSADKDTLDLRIEDHGAGFDAESVLSGVASSGLTGMRERATLLGGRLSVASTPGSGTTVVAELPLVESIEKRRKPQ